MPIARVGWPSPVSGRNYGPAFGPLLTPSGDVVFIADVSVGSDGTETSVFLYTRGKYIVIAAPGVAMPGGGTFARTGFANQNVTINNQGDIVFVATLTNGDQGLYRWRHGILSLVAKTGTDTGAGTILNLDDFGNGFASSQVSVNDAGQILFAAKFQGGGGAMLVATPR